MSSNPIQYILENSGFSACQSRFVHLKTDLRMEDRFDLPATHHSTQNAKHQHLALLPTGVWPPPGDGFHQGPLTPNPTRKDMDYGWVRIEVSSCCIHKPVKRPFWSRLTIASCFQNQNKNPRPYKSISYL